MKPDPFQVVITISHQRKFCRYAFEIRGSSNLSRKACGRISSSTANTLLAYAAIGALKTVSPSAIAKLKVEAGLFTSRKVALRCDRKLNVTIKTSDKEFADWCADFTIRCALKTVPRSSQQLSDHLKLQLRRFNVRYELVDEDKTFALRDWAAKILPTATYPDGFPQPSIVQQSK